jgi:WD40-like Beta Propeller Repeat
MRLLLALALFAPGGVERAAENGAQASLTPNGRLLVYVQNDPKGVADVFVLDRRSGRRERVSVGSRGQRGKGASIEPSISDDGRFVAFCSYAPNFAPNDPARASTTRGSTGSTGRLTSSAGSPATDRPVRLTDVRRGAGRAPAPTDALPPQRLVALEPGTRPGGFEPPTRGLEVRCSSTELRALEAKGSAGPFRVLPRKRRRGTS